MSKSNNTARVVVQARVGDGGEWRHYVQVKIGTQVFTSDRPYVRYGHALNAAKKTGFKVIE